MAHPNRKFSFIIVLSVLGAMIVCLASSSWAAGQEKSEKERGWFWYKDPKEKPQPEEIKLEAPPPPPPAPEEPKKPEDRPFSVAWLRKKIEILRDNSIEKPTEENLRAYMYAQRLMIDMSQNFAEVGSKVARTDPMLNEEVRFPFATAQRREALFAVSKARDLVLSDLSGKVGLWFFFDSTCAFCAGQYRTLMAMTKKRGFILRAVSVDGKGLPGMGAFTVDKAKAVFTKLELKLTPAVVMVRPPNDYYIVAHGAMAESDLEDKILAAAVDRDLVPAELKTVVSLEKRGLLKPEDVDKIRSSMKDTDDPKELVEMMNKAIQGRF